jgi:hypothetical protein
MKDIIIGAFENYSQIDLKPWMNSIKKCGFDGDVLLIVYGREESYLKSWSEFVSEKPNYILITVDTIIKNVVCDRFLSVHKFLSKNEKYDYVFFTDPKDIVFQTNPSEFIRKKIKNQNKIICGSESVLYKDETWGNANMLNSYKEYYEYMKDKIIYNAGSISGERKIVSELFSDIFKLSIKTHVWNPDQAAFNILIQTKYKNNCHFSGIEDGYAVQCGTVANPHRLFEYGDKILEFPILENGVAYNSKKEKVCILHQYPKVPTFHEEVIKNYNENLY